MTILSSEPASIHLSRIKQIVREAEITDYIMPLWLPYLGAILAVIIGIALLVTMYASEHVSTSVSRIHYAAPMIHGRMDSGSSILVGAGIMALLAVGFIGIIIELYVVYKWIARRNAHFSRIQRLYAAVIDYLEALGVKDPEYVSMKNIAEEARFRESEKSAGLWVILYLVLGFIAWAYIMHFLTRDFVEHEQRERLFFKNLADILKKRNIVLELPQWSIPDRNTVLYLVLTIVTIGLFGLYWVYIVTNDPNKHFMEHRVFEQRLLDSLEALGKA